MFSICYFTGEYMLYPIMLVWLSICAVKSKQPAMFVSIPKGWGASSKMDIFFMFAKPVVQWYRNLGGMGGNIPNSLTMVIIWALVNLWSFLFLFFFFVFVSFFSLHLISGTKTLQVSVKTFVFGLFLICSKSSWTFVIFYSREKIVIESYPPNA